MKNYLMETNDTQYFIEANTLSAAKIIAKNIAKQDHKSYFRVKELIKEKINNEIK